MMLPPEEFEAFLQILQPGYVQTPSPANITAALPEFTRPIAFRQV